MNWFVGQLEVLYGLDGDLKNFIRYYTIFFDYEIFKICVFNFWTPF